MTYADNLILDESRVGRFEPGLPNLTSYRGCSTLSGPNIQRYAIGGSARTVEAGHSLATKRQPKVATQDRDALKAAVLAAGGTLDRGHGWLLTMDRAGHLRHRRAVPTRVQRDRRAYIAARQAQHEARWALSVHLCDCGCQTPVGPGHYDRPRCFAPGHTSRSARSRQQAAYREAARKEKAEMRASRRVRILGGVAA